MTDAPAGSPDDRTPGPDAEDAEPADPDAPGRVEHGSDEEIDEAGDESFPASDAPQWWSGEPGDDDA